MSLVTDFAEPIECPYCHKALTLVQIQVTKVVEWTIDDEDKENEGGFMDNGQGATEVFCYNCKKRIGYSDANAEWGLFPASHMTDF
ncbi:MAG: hypothetical protein NWE94_02795 [Candidatus Bathyarchaeota archaeon]|nr:hypothetical protein [Candidatus Bathyarchaeota archaeon]